jgi:prefoldin subunit 5
MTDTSYITSDIVQYVFGGKDSASDDAMALICILERYLMSSGLGEHPNAEGCDQKFEAVKEAYLKEETDAHVVKEEIRKRIEELKEKIDVLKEMLKEAIDGKSISELIDELGILYDEFKEIGTAIYNLPEYTDLTDSYAEILGTLQETTFILEDKVETLEIMSEEMKGQISELEDQLEQYKQQAGIDDELIAKLTAKAIRVNIQTDVTFPDEKVKIVVNWDKDENAAGYTFKVNGVVTEPTATATGFEYVDSAANVGETYKYEVRPYIIYNEEKIEGRNYKATVVPNVKISKGVIKSLKKGTQSFTVKWKKVSGASGYQVSYKVSGKKAVKKTVTGGKKTSLKVKNLESGKKYTVKVRAWKTVNGKKYYGKWSNAKKVTVK